MFINPVIYAIINIVNDKHYIGQTYDKLKRFSEHRKTLRTGKHCNRLLQRAYYKYGETNFIFIVLENCELETLISKEQHWINILKPEYNLAPVAGSQLGYKHTNEAKANMSRAHKGYKHTEETKAKMATAKLGNKNNTGKKRMAPTSEETRKKISEAKIAGYAKRKAALDRTKVLKLSVGNPLGRIKDHCC